MYFKIVIKSEVRFNGLDLFVSTNETKFYPGFRDLDQDVNCHILTFILSSGSDQKCYMGSLFSSPEKESSLQVYQCSSFRSSNQSGKVLLPWSLSFFSVRCSHQMNEISLCWLCTVNNLLSVIWNSKRLDPAQRKGDRTENRPQGRDRVLAGGSRVVDLVVV